MERMPGVGKCVLPAAGYYYNKSKSLELESCFKCRYTEKLNTQWRSPCIRSQSVAERERAKLQACKEKSVRLRHELAEFS